MYFVGLDVHKRTISHCVKDAAGRVHQRGKVGSTRRELDSWIRTIPQPRIITMEATIFAGWIYDHMFSSCGEGKGRASTDSKGDCGGQEEERQDRSSKIADCLGCDFRPECHMDSTEIRGRRRTLRYRNLLVRQTECHELAVIHAREPEGRNPNRATMAVARKMVCYMHTVERRNQDFVPAEQFCRRRAAAA